MLKFRPLPLLLLFAALVSSGWSFVYYPVGNNPLRWNVNAPGIHTNVVNPVTKAVRYYIASDAYSTANREAEIAAVKACFDQWQSIAGSSLRFEFAGLISPEGLDVREDNTNVVFWAKSNLRVAGGQMNISGLRGWTSVNFAADGSILEADIVLNGSQYQWFTDFNNTTGQAQFVEAVLLHEIGHFVGLDHAVAGGATVISGANGVSSEAGLSADEIAAMRFLYPVAQWESAGIQGVIRLNGTPILGAVVVAEDTAGNVAAATVSRADGAYDIRGLAPGTYNVRVTPLDPATAGTDKLIQGRDVAPEYTGAVTTFSSTPDRIVELSSESIASSHFDVASGPAFRITSISKPTTIPDLISVFRTAMTVRQGQGEAYVGVSGRDIPGEAELSVTGDGLTIGPTTFYPDRFGPGLHSLVARVNVSASATPGLRSFVVTHGNNRAYANGFLEVAASIPDYNFDTLDDRFQRAFWSPWTRAESGPAADPDGDGFSNEFEYRTGTDPTSAESFHLAISGISHDAGTLTISWASDLGKRYQLYGRSLLNDGAWQPVGRAFTATSTNMSLTDTAGEGARYYRLELER